MIKNDYLMEKLDKLNDIIADINELNNNKQFDSSYSVINQAFKQLLGLNPDIVESLSYKDLLHFVGAYGSTEVYKYVILAELLRQDALINKLKGNLAKSFNSNIKSFNIYAKALSIDPETCLELAEDRLEAVIGEINDYELTYDTKLSLFQCYENTGKFDKAEDVLYDIIETEENNNIRAEGINFYNRLIKKSEKELEQGNLTLKEVEEGLKDWQRKGE